LFFCITQDGIVCGVLYTQRINSLDELTSNTYAEQHLLHVDDGSIVQLCAIAVNLKLSEGSKINFFFKLLMNFVN
jgi:hypothetical protein